MWKSLWRFVREWVDRPAIVSRVDGFCARSIRSAALPSETRLDYATVPRASAVPSRRASSRASPERREHVALVSPGERWKFNTNAHPASHVHQVRGTPGHRQLSTRVRLASTWYVFYFLFFFLFSHSFCHLNRRLIATELSKGFLARFFPRIIKSTGRAIAQRSRGRSRRWRRLRRPCRGRECRCDFYHPIRVRIIPYVCYMIALVNSFLINFLFFFLLFLFIF